MPEPAPLRPEPTLDLKNRWLAAVLALLVPGLGHLYQGRTFKAVVYAVCILGLFFSGQALGDWKVVYLGDSDAAGRLAAGRGLVKRLLQGYIAQFPVGLAAWPAIPQSLRYDAPENSGRAILDAPLDADFRGGIWPEAVADLGREPAGPALVTVSGRLLLSPPAGNAEGRFVGTTADGKPIEFKVSGLRDLGQRIAANAERVVMVGMPDPPDLAALRGKNAGRLMLAGGIPRPLLDRYQVPLGDRGEDLLTAELGGRLEIAYVFTWIAGLLNVLAIWDALDGPAYGFGHEPELNEKRKKRRREPDAAPKRQPEPVGR